MSEEVLLEVSSGVATITLNRPDAANTLNLAMATKFDQALEAAGHDDSARVLLIRGAGANFSAGGDLKAMASSDDRGHYLAAVAEMAHRAVGRLVTLDKVVIAEVHGAAAGAGLSWLLACDIVIAARTAKFLTAFTSVGLTPDNGLSWLLPRVVGLGRALDITLQPRRLAASEALEWGIVSRVVEPEDVRSEALTTARALADGPAEALGQARLLLREGWHSSLDQHLDAEAQTISRMAATKATGDRIDAFLARG